MFVKDESLPYGGRRCHMTNHGDVTDGCLATCNVVENGLNLYQLELWIVPHHSGVFFIGEISVLHSA